MSHVTYEFVMSHMIESCRICMCHTQSWFIHRARSVEDETRNGRRNAKRTANRNHETVLLGLFSCENVKRDIKR